MNLAVVIPSKVRNRWLFRHVAHSIAKKHPDITLVSFESSSAECLFVQYARNNGIPVTTPPPVPVAPTSWWGRFCWWLTSSKRKPWHPLDHADAALVFWDDSTYAKEVLRKCFATGKKVWLVRTQLGN